MLTLHTMGDSVNCQRLSKNRQTRQNSLAFPVICSPRDRTLVIHGGAGWISKESVSDSLEQSYIKTLGDALIKGRAIIKEGGSSLDAVQLTIEHKRAVAIAGQAGSGIGAITKADTGTFQITVPNSTDMGRYGSYDTRTIEKDITAVMGVTFRVQ